MDKLFYLENNRIKLVRHIVSYNETVITNTLKKVSGVTQYLNNDSALEELLDRLNRKGVSMEVKTIDTRLYEIHENKIVNNIQEAELLVNPSIETVKKMKLTEVEYNFNRAISEGIELEINGEKVKFNIGRDDLMYYRELILTEKDEYEILSLDKDYVRVNKDQFNTIISESSKRYMELYEHKSNLISEITKSEDITTINSILN